MWITNIPKNVSIHARKLKSYRFNYFEIKKNIKGFLNFLKILSFLFFNLLTLFCNFKNIYKYIFNLKYIS